MLFTHHLDPILLSLGPIVLHWYGLMYAFAFLFGYVFLQHAARHGLTTLTGAQLENLTLAMAAGVVVGGRTGYFLFYTPHTFLTDPLEYFRVWHGGMSFHGGLLGVAIVLWILARKWRRPILELADLIALPAAVGLIFGRLGNWINGELPGRLTDGSWGVIFPHTDGLPRYPAQLYAAAKDLFLSLILAFLWHGVDAKKRPTGTLSFAFLTIYGLMRFLVEFWREPLDGYFGILTVGQAYSIPVFLVGLWGLFELFRRRVA